MFLASEARTLVAAFQSLARRPLEGVEVPCGWRRFGVMEKSSYGNVVAMLLLLIAVEAPAVHLILGAVIDDGALRGVVRSLLLGSSIYVALWLIGDLRLLRETPGVLLGEGVLLVDMGVRARGELALANVTGAHVIVDQDADPTEGTRTIRITPLPRPNCRIRLSCVIRMSGMFGIPLEGDVLDVYVDDPADLVSSIEAASAAA